MKLLTLAAGLAVGYVLGTRAGRERFEQLAGEARKLSNHPKVAEMQDKAKQVLRGDTDRRSSTNGATTAVVVPETPTASATTVAESPA